MTLVGSGAADYAEAVQDCCEFYSLMTGWGRGLRGAQRVAPSSRSPGQAGLHQLNDALCVADQALLLTP